MDAILQFLDWQYLLKIFIRLTLSFVVGILIGRERANHGRAAGTRTHILVCLGSALTSMISLYIADVLGSTGDITRISAQVISGIGFLGAGMIILKNNNVITGLTTAAGVWTTSIIGIAIGYGFYAGAVIATILFLFTTVLLSKFGKNKNSKEIIYVEIDDMYKTNETLNKFKELMHTDLSYSIIASKSGNPSHLGIAISVNKGVDFDVEKLLEIDGVVYFDEE